MTHYGAVKRHAIGIALLTASDAAYMSYRAQGDQESQPEIAHQKDRGTVEANMKGKAGRPSDPVRATYRKEYRLTKRKAALAMSMLSQLEGCKDDAMRRLLLGVSK